LAEFEAEIVRFAQIDPLSHPKAVAISMHETKKPEMAKNDKRPKLHSANQARIKSFFTPKAAPSQVVPTPPPTNKRAGKRARER
jgi:hypothetical protein